MYSELLKEQYYKERKKLEGMWIFKQESKLRFLKLKNDITDKLQDRLSIGELLGRADINEEVKDAMLRENEDKVKERLDENIENERAGIVNEEKGELAGAKYSPGDYADYLFQLEMVYVLEDALSEERIFPEQVYLELSQEEKENGK